MFRLRACPMSLSSYTECPRCQADIRLRRSDRTWCRCRFCSHEFDPSEGVEPLEWSED